MPGFNSEIIFEKETAKEKTT